MARKPRPPFDPKSFLAKVGEGRSIGRYRKDQIVFSQGDPADAVFYTQKGKVKVTVVSEQGKEAVVAILGTDEFFGEGCLAGQSQPVAPAAGELWQGRETGTHNRENQPGDARRDDRNDAVTREFLHEQISKIGLHYLQRQHRGPQFIVERGSARTTANQDLNAPNLPRRPPIGVRWCQPHR
jgi:CRP-like cAMP-binding protein